MEGRIILKEVNGVSTSLIELKWQSSLLLIQRQQKVKPKSLIFNYLYKMKRITKRRLQDYFYNASEVIFSTI